MAGLSLYDVSDPEFLAIVKDNVDADGWISSFDLAKAFGDPVEKTQSVSCRLTWMKRFGVVERDTNRRKPDGEINDSYAKWRLTETGEIAVNAKFNSAEFKALQGLQESKYWLISQFLSDRLPDTEAAYYNLSRRQLRLGFSRRRS